MADYIKSKSWNVQKYNPTKLKDGDTIFEQDVYTVDDNKYSIKNGRIIIKTDTGFEYVSSIDDFETRKYNTTSTSTSATLSDLYEADSTILNDTDNTTDKNIILKKDYLKLKDFTYFGSSNAFVQYSIEDIINNFPAGVVLTSYITSNNILTINEVNNPFGVDLLKYEETADYDIRTLSTSYYNYVAYELITNTGGTITETEIGNVLSYTGTTTSNLNAYIEIDNIQSPTNPILIKPNSTITEAFFNDLDDLQFKLLNRYSTPKYKSEFIISKENGDGVTEEYINFTWNTDKYGYNLDIESADYAMFINNIIEATLINDELYSDNIYRMLAHDTIKNLDNTYEKIIDDERVEEILVGGTKIQKLLRLYGCVYDDIKKYIEGISIVNNITYDGYDNIPNELLSNKLDSMGIIPNSFVSVIGGSVSTDISLFPNTNKSYSTLDVNYELYRRLILSSKSILNSKGSTKAIKDLFGIFGFNSDWYSIIHLVQPVGKFLKTDELKNIAQIIYDNNLDGTTETEGKSEFTYKFDETLFDGVNVGIFCKCPVCDSENYITSGYTTDVTGICENGHSFLLTDNMYGYPKYKQSDNFYYQQMGGWYKETGGQHITETNNYVYKNIEGNNPHIGNGNYDYGFDYIQTYGELFRQYYKENNNTDTYNLGEHNNFDINFKRTNIDDIKDIIDNKLLLNLKNYIIGIDGIKILNDLYSSAINLNEKDIEIESTNTSAYDYDITNIINDGYYYSLNLSKTSLLPNDLVTEASFVCDYTGETSFILKINGWSGKTINNCLISDEGYFVKITTSNSIVTVEKYYGENEYNLLKNIIINYLTQLIPSDALFDILLIQDDVPKWQLVDNYMERDDNGVLTGYNVLSYQNINYFDTKTTDYSSIYNLIEADFGTGYTYFNTIIKNNIFDYLETEESNVFGEIPLLLEDGNKINVNTSQAIGFDNIYQFKKLTEQYSGEATWVNNTDYIIT